MLMCSTIIYTIVYIYIVHASFCLKDFIWSVATTLNFLSNQFHSGAVFDRKEYLYRLILGW